MKTVARSWIPWLRLLGLAPAPARDPLDKHAIIDGFADALERGEKHTEPFLHYQFRPFSDDLYAAILKYLPDDRFFIELRHADAMRPDGTSSRLVLPVQKAMISRLNRERRDFWSELSAIMCAPELRDIFKARLELDLRRRFKCSLDEIPAIPKLMLMRDFPSYKINIHHDIEWKTITTQYYLPCDDSQRDLGTAIYRRQPDGDFLQTHKIDFLPGNAYCFAVSDDSWHAVAPVGEIPRPRNSMMLIYFRDKGHDY